MSDTYIRRRNHLYLAEAERVVKNGIVRFAGYTFTAPDLHRYEGRVVRVWYHRGKERLVLLHRCTGEVVLLLNRTLNPPKSDNLPIWEFDNWMPILPKKGRRAS